MNPIRKTDILIFFLKIYKAQVGTMTAPARFTRLCSQDTGSDEVYELSVRRKDGKWRSRRMSIAPLAEESGSKSRCFKVIYDDILVVKIPPTPVRDLDQYLRNIDRERETVALLTPDIECITPGLSAILRKIPPFSRDADADGAEFEQRCINRLKVFPNFQDYLKIRGQFAFFMNLSRYAFMGQVIARMYDLNAGICRELLEQGMALTDPVAFEDRYGKDCFPVFFDINDAYSRYEAQLDSLLGKHHISASVPVYKKQAWFCAGLAGQSAEDNGTFEAEFLSDLNDLLRKIIHEQERAVVRYKNVVRTYVYGRAFYRNKSQIAGILVNLLRMLGFLKRRGVAMRDLKPDNVFIAGDPSALPALLGAPEDYAIGLIDFETAVRLRPGPGQKIPQPMLGGTPPYATPGNLFKNDVLSQVFEDLPRILHLQDWQAVIGMTYKAVTGRQLFRDTGDGITDMMNTAKMLCKKRDMPKAEVFRCYSRMFWYTAAHEFRMKLNRGRGMLSQVRVGIPWNARRLFKEELHGLTEDIAREMRYHVLTQQLFKSPRSQQSLLNSPLEMLIRFRDNWEKGVDVPSVPPPVRTRVIHLLRKFVLFRQRSGRALAVARLMNTRKPVLSASELLEIMFDVVSAAMYRSEWGEPCRPGDLCEPESQPLPEDAIVVTSREAAELEHSITQMTVH